MTDARRIRLIKFLLRVMGGFTVIAFAAMLLPPDWMAAIHERLGLGPFPRSAIVDYLARSSAALYGFHGVLLLVIATHPVKYKAFVSYTGIMYVAFGVMIIGVDVVAGLPWWWTAIEGPGLIPFGAALLLLNRRVPNEAASGALSAPRGHTSRGRSNENGTGAVAGPSVTAALTPL